MEYEVTTEQAKTVRIDHEKASYAIFCFNSSGDLFINSDWGFYGYAWRSFGDDFEKFLSKTNSDYIVGKLEINYNSVRGNVKGIPKTWKENLTILVDCFIKSLNKS